MRALRSVHVKWLVPSNTMESEASGSLASAASEFFSNALAGTIGGVAGVFVGSPLDVVKTRIQTGGRISTASLPGSQLPRAPAGPSAIGILRDIISKEGPRALFKGSVTASLGQAPNNFIVFGSYGATLDWLVARRAATGGGSAPGAEASGSMFPGIPRYTDLYLAGCTAGLLQSFALTPFEYVKVQQQVHGGHSTLPASSVIKDVIRHLGVRGLWTGLAATVLRDCPTYGVYFVTFEATKRAFGTVKQGSTSTGGTNATADTAPVVDAPVWVVLLGGALAGASSWCLATPVDVLKSIIQATQLDQRSPRLRDVAQQVYASHGLSGFTRGLIPLMVRSMPVNAVTFFTYEWALACLQDKAGLPATHITAHCESQAVAIDVAAITADAMAIRPSASAASSPRHHHHAHLYGHKDLAGHLHAHQPAARE